jgi:hypothetical protein
LILAVSWVPASLHNFSRMAKGSLWWIVATEDRLTYKFTAQVHREYSGVQI